MSAAVTTGETDRLWVCAPYFDEHGETLHRLKDRFAARVVVVLLQERETNLTHDVASKLLTAGIVPLPVEYCDQNGTPRFLHAKFYGLERADRVTVIFGSANCSAAAWLVPGHKGNAELVAFCDLTKEEFTNLFLQEFRIALRLPQLVSQRDHQPQRQEPRFFPLKVLAARFMKLEGVVRVGFKKREDIEITHCLINGHAVPFQIDGRNALSARAIERPASLELKGVGAMGEVISNPLWVDHEFELSTSAKERALAETIHRSVREGIWGLPVFIDILKLLQDHLEYLT